MSDKSNNKVLEYGFDLMEGFEFEAKIRHHIYEEKGEDIESIENKNNSENMNNESKNTEQDKEQTGSAKMTYNNNESRDRAYERESNKLVGVETERRLTVGSGISLKGEISDCDKLVIFGDVEVKLNNVNYLHITESGVFHGSAEVEGAEISGLFEGDLSVKGHVVINSTGRVNGKITYGSIEIKPGGKFTGEIIEEEYKLGGKSGRLQRPVSAYGGREEQQANAESDSENVSFDEVEI